MSEPYKKIEEEEVEFPQPPPMIPGSSNLRMRAIEAAVQAAIKGIGYNVVGMAEQYVDFALGKAVQAPFVPFRVRLREMMEREILSEQTDLERLRHDVQEVFGEVEDAHWPKPWTPLTVDEAGRPAPIRTIHTAINDPGHDGDHRGVGGPEDGIPPLLKEAFKGMAGMSHSGAPDSSAEGMTVNFAAMGDGK